MVRPFIGSKPRSAPTSPCGVEYELFAQIEPSGARLIQRDSADVKYRILNWIA